jgi:ATP-dependent Clp protease ATP-binding subunit ClpA
VSPSLVLLMLITENSDQCFKIFRKYGIKLDQIVDKLCDIVNYDPRLTGDDSECIFSDNTIEIINRSWCANSTSKNLLVSADKLFENLVEDIFNVKIKVRNTEINTLNLF